MSTRKKRVRTTPWCTKRDATSPRWDSTSRSSLCAVVRVRVGRQLTHANTGCRCTVPPPKAEKQVHTNNAYHADHGTHLSSGECCSGSVDTASCSDDRRDDEACRRWAQHEQHLLNALFSSLSSSPRPSFTHTHTHARRSTRDTDPSLHRGEVGREPARTHRQAQLFVLVKRCHGGSSHVIQHIAHVCVCVYA